MLLELSEMNNLKLVLNKREFLRLKKVSAERSAKAGLKVYEICDPMQAEAAAILWALQIAKAENMERIEVEGDAKSCLMLLKEAAPLLHSLSNL